MISKNIKNLLGGIYQVLLLEDLFPHHIRRVVMHMFGSASLILVLVMLFGGEAFNDLIKGGLFVTSSLTLFLFTLECYFYSVVVRARKDFFVSFDIGEVLFYAENEDLTHALLFSEIGDEGMKKLGFSESQIKDYLINRNHVISSGILNSITDHIYYEDYFRLVYKNDPELQDYLFKLSILEEDFVGAMVWAVNKNRKIIEKERFWSIENLSKIPGIGKNWSYGETYTLEKYGEDLTESVTNYSSTYENSKDQAIRRLESVLTRGRGSNAIVVSNDDVSRMDIVTMFAKRINEAKLSINLQHKRVYLINHNAIIDNTGDKVSFEREMSNILNESIHAGNIILAISGLTSFIQSAKVLGSNVLDILAPYVQNTSIHIVALDSKKQYLDFLSSQSIISENFEMISTDVGDDNSLILMLTEEADQIEQASKMIVTYQAISKIIASAHRYFDPSIIAEKSRDMIVESLQIAADRGSKKVEPIDIMTLVERVTGIPTIAPSGEEKNMLKNIEELLHTRIIGQDEAIKALATSLKRNRSGVASPDKPIGTFLFLGPTGVGKTETTKALADIVFNKEDSISRFDMSEFSDTNSVERLIGSFGTGKSGVLSSSLRDKPYGILLLDEFEKTTDDVINLFLRIFDEGVFTDSEGKKINAKNNIIIATSNAGSDIIWDIIRGGEDLISNKDKIINSIISQGIFKPELLNRFDAIVLFHPLSQKDLRGVAILMMNKFRTRMRDRGVMIEWTDKFINFLVSKGSDPKFGARPMNRAIIEEVERVVADKILDNEIYSGISIIFDIVQGEIQIKPN